MAAVYIDIDPHACRWTENLIAAGLVAPGEVWNVDIRDVRPIDLKGFQQVHLFSGIGAWSHALRSANWPDDREVFTVSCPCQPFSAVGGRTGLADERHLWPAADWLIGQLRPAIIFAEQVSSKDGLAWFDVVHADLDAKDYAVGALDLCAAGFGAPHIRQRLYICAVADAEGVRLPRRKNDEHEGRGQQTSRQGCSTPNETNGFWRHCDWKRGADKRLRAVEPGVEPVVDGSAFRLGSGGPYEGKSRRQMLKGYGNAIVAPLATEVIKALMECVP